MSRPHLLVALCALMLPMLTGCGTWRAYEGAARSDEDVATLYVARDIVPGSLIVNGTPCPSDRVHRVELLPGAHTVGWSYRHSNRYVQHESLDFVAGAGDRLVMRHRFESPPSPLGPAADAVGFVLDIGLAPLTMFLPAGEEPPPGVYHCWIETRDERDIVAGIPPDLPIGYVEITAVPIE